MVVKIEWEGRSQTLLEIEVLVDTQNGDRESIIYSPLDS